jgi:hypothetical protein
MLVSTGISMCSSLYRFSIIITIFVICVFTPNISAADVPKEQVAEVNHLLAFINNSGCIIKRNGTKHPAFKGVEHIRNKYNYFRDEINNTEDFIKYSATKSTLTGNYYLVSCSGRKFIKTRDWLLTELNNFRTK